MAWFDLSSPPTLATLAYIVGLYDDATICELKPAKSKNMLSKGITGILLPERAVNSLTKTDRLWHSLLNPWACIKMSCCNHEVCRHCFFFSNNFKTVRLVSKWFHRKEASKSLSVSETPSSSSFPTKTQSTCLASLFCLKSKRHLVAQWQTGDTSSRNKANVVVTMHKGPFMS